MNDFRGEKVTGMEEQIFEHSRRENTRRYVRRLKVLEQKIDSRDYDFIGMRPLLREEPDLPQDKRENPAGL